VNSLSRIPPSLAEPPPRRKFALLLRLYEFLLRAGVQSGTESIQFVIQSDELIREIVFHFALVSRCHTVKPHDF
jgi:hypothetical protein